jgi:MATE family multidrug resistance protein
VSSVPSLREELRLLVRLSWPIAAAQLGLMAMGLVDTAVLGRVSVTELAGSSIGRAVMFAFITPAMGLAMALEPLASQAVGAGERSRALGALRATSRAVLFIGVPLIALGVVALFTLEATGVAPATASRARAFAIAQSPGMVLTLLFLTHKTFLQSQGSTRPALVAAGIANVVNLVVCNVLVRGDEFLSACGLPALGFPRLGATGAGLAYSIASGVMTAVVAFASRKQALASPAGPPDDSVTVQHVISLGAPLGLQLLAEVGVFALSTVLVGRFGSAAVSAHQVALSMASFTFMGALGFSGGTAVRVGYAVGEGRSPRRAGLMGLACGAAFMAFSGAGFALFPITLVRLFTTDPDVIALGRHLMIIAALFQLFDGLQVVGGGALRGAGDVRFPFVATTFAHWVIGFPCAILLGFTLHMGVTGIWWGLAAGLVAVAALLVVRFVTLTSRPVVRV